jgi:O-antigen/teichoic acid export membrane protein
MFLNRNFFNKTLGLNIMINGKFLIALITQFILIKYLEPAIFGKFVIILVLVDLVFSLTIVEQQGILRYQNKKNIIDTSLILCNYFSYFLFFVSLIAFSIISYLKNFPTEILYICIGVIFSRWIKYRLIVSESILEKKLHYYKIYKYYLINSLVSNGICLIFLFLNYGIYALLVREIIESVILWFFIRNKKKIHKNNFNLTTAKFIVKFSLQGALINLLNMFQFKFIFIFLGFNANLVVLGFFERATFILFSISNLFSQLADRIFVPLINNNKDIKSKNLILNIFFIYKLFIFLPIGLILYFFSDKIILFMFGEKWFFTGEIISILSFWLVFNSLYQVFERWIFTHDTKKYSVLSSLISFIIILFAAFYIYSFDSKNWIVFAWALNFSSLLNLIISIILSVKIKKTFLILKPIYFSISCYLIGFFIFTFYSNLNLFFIITIYLIIYGFLTYFFFKNDLVYYGQHIKFNKKKKTINFI